MTGQDEDSAQTNLTGVWQGRYAYGLSAVEVDFTATLIHTGASVTGMVHEADVLGHATLPVLFASIEGSCAGGQVRFTKTYDGSGGWAHSVHYEGELTDGGHEILGLWTIGREASGAFVMARPRRKASAVTRKTAAPVGR